jgi:hypothetical protein
MSDNYDGPQLAQKILRQQSEIKRLRELFRIQSELNASHIKGLNETLETERKALVSEIERLREAFVDVLADPVETRYHAQIDRQALEIERLHKILQSAPCTCPNPEPYDWPHDPNNPNCYLNRTKNE